MIEVLYDEKTQIKQKHIDLLFKIIMYFTIGCFIGVVLETILCLFQTGHLESRQGLIYGPFNPVYGFGLVAIVLLLEKSKKWYSIFIKGALLGGIVEYLCSFVQEILFGTISWDYSEYLFNINGRTSIYHMIWWGILCLGFMKVAYPYINNKIFEVDKNKRLIVAVALFIFFSIDIVISVGASIRQDQRYNNIVATSRTQVFFDKYYPDEFMDAIYPNKMKVKQ